MKPGNTRSERREGGEVRTRSSRSPRPKGTNMCRIYVKRNEYQRFDTLYHAFRTSIPGADVLWDRRMRDRRKDSARAEVVDRRWNERRVPPPESWHALGFVVTDATRRDHRRWPSAPARRPASPPRLLTHGLVEPSVAELKGTFVRIAENLVGEIVRRLKTSPECQRELSLPAPPSTEAVDASIGQPTPTPRTAPPGSTADVSWRIVWPPTADRN
jgi:hypothetical protein